MTKRASTRQTFLGIANINSKQDTKHNFRRVLERKQKQGNPGEELSLGRREGELGLIRGPHASF